MAIDILATSDFLPMRASPPVSDAATSESAPSVTTVTMPTDTIVIEGRRGAKILFASNCTSGNTATATFYGVGRTRRPLGDDPSNLYGYVTWPLGTLALTFSLAGTANVFYPFGNFIASTMAWTAGTMGTGLLTYTGGNAADVDLASYPSLFLISDFGSLWGITMRFTTYSVIASGKTANGFISLDV